MNELIAEIGRAAQVIAAPNWADKLSVALSFVGILISAIVALVIMHKQNEITQKQVGLSQQQNRIALFEKRYEIYELIQMYKHFIWLIHATAKQNEDLCRLYVMSRSTIGIIKIEPELFDRNIVANHIMDSAQKLHQAGFLFSQDITDYAKCLGRELQMIAVLCLHPESESIKSRKESLKELLDRYDSEGLSEKIAEEMRITIGEKSK